MPGNYAELLPFSCEHPSLVVCVCTNAPSNPVLNGGGLRVCQYYEIGLSFKPCDQIEGTATGPGITIVIPQPSQKPDLVTGLDVLEIGGSRTETVTISIRPKLWIEMCTVV